MYSDYPKTIPERFNGSAEQLYLLARNAWTREKRYGEFKTQWMPEIAQSSVRFHFGEDPSESSWLLAELSPRGGCNITLGVRSQADEEMWLRLFSYLQDEGYFDAQTAAAPAPESRELETRRLHAVSETLLENRDYSEIHEIARNNKLGVISFQAKDLELLIPTRTSSATDRAVESPQENDQVAISEQPQTNSPLESSPPGNCFHKEGEVWRIVFNGADAIHVPAVKGLDYIAYLLRNPQKTIPILELVVAVEGEQTSAIELSVEERAEEGLDSTGFSLPDEVYDSPTPEIMKARLMQLSKMRLEADDDSEEMRKIDDECEKIETYLMNGKGFAGRTRTFNSEAEKERQRVYNAVKSAKDKLRGRDRALADHLDKSIQIRMRCSYSPDIATVWET